MFELLKARRLNAEPPAAVLHTAVITFDYAAWDDTAR